MDYPLLPARFSRKTWIDRIQAFLEVLLLSGILSSFLAALLLFGLRHAKAALLLTSVPIVTAYLLLESAIAFFILAMILKYHGETIRDLGLHRDQWMRHLALGLSLVPLLFIINAIVAFGFKTFLSRYYQEINPLTDMIHTPKQLALFIFSALIAGGVKEELQRAFIINRFRSFLGGAGAGLILWSLAFGAGHYVQGPQAIVAATIYGLFFGIAYISSGSLIAPIIAHSAYDTLALLAYWFFSSRTV
jgi:membrane protease YdiL (CAAX protease family)